MFQAQQGYGSQSVRGNYKTCFCWGINLKAVEGNASVCQVHPASRTTCEGRADIFKKHGGLGLNQRERGAWRGYIYIYIVTTRDTF